MQPYPIAIYIDAGLVRMGNQGIGQFLLCAIFKISQKTKSFFVEIVNRSFADRHINLICKMILYPVIWNQLILGHIHRMGFKSPIRIGPPW